MENSLFLLPVNVYKAETTTHWMMLQVFIDLGIYCRNNGLIVRIIFDWIMSDGAFLLRGAWCLNIRTCCRRGATGACMNEQHAEDDSSVKHEYQVSHDLLLNSGK